ncbi:kinase-like domain-containing protein [Mycena crocata]|nr:kinase-like domain-containing protein [Mycena crocata]
MDQNSEQYAQAAANPQCRTCGIAWKRLPFTDQCGVCHENALAAAGAINHGLNVAVAARSSAFQNRINRPPRPNALAAAPPQPTIDLNTAALDKFRNVGFNDADCIKVYAEARVNGKIDQGLGFTSRAYPPDTQVLEIMRDLIDGWNIPWLKTRVFALLLEDAELRFHGNQNILPDTQFYPILDFYSVHKSSASWEAYFSKMPKYAAAMKGKVVAIELYITTGDQQSKSKAVTTVKKRKSTSKPAPEDAENISKRPRLSGTVETNFVRQLPGPDPANSTTVKLRFADITVNPDSSETTITWPTDDTLTEALVANDIFQSGKMKRCYKMSIGDEQYVVKWFFEIGRGVDEVTLAENHRELRNEIERYEIMRWFLSKFREAAEVGNVETAKNFEISQCRLAEEVVPTGESPSSASNIAAEVLESTPNGKIVWFIEPLRNAAVTHYTGTMDHPAGTGQLAHTLAALVHFAFQHSYGTILFADLQGSVGRLSTNKMGILIFDPMTHSPEETSGVGDHGSKGIDRWRAQHDCNTFCKRLELEAGDSSDEDDQ